MDCNKAAGKTIPLGLFGEIVTTARVFLVMAFSMDASVGSMFASGSTVRGTIPSMVTAISRNGGHHAGNGPAHRGT